VVSRRELYCAAFEDAGHLIDQKLDELGGLLQPGAGAGVDAHHIDSLTT
jgi:hypothetical protein